jgi:hypothetical protein
MFAGLRFLMVTLIVCSLAPALRAEAQIRSAGDRAGDVIASATAEETLRVTSWSGVCQMRVQIRSAEGAVAFDSMWRDGSVLDLPPGSIDLATSGFARFVVMVKDLDGRVLEREASLTKNDGRLTARHEGDGDRIVMIESGSSELRVALLTHDGENAQLVSTGGDLSFRFGEFFGATDVERMRLTAAGNLGIGLENPQAPLDVNGLIRTSAGIQFSDGSILTTAAGLPSGEEQRATVPTRRSASRDGRSARPEARALVTAPGQTPTQKLVPETSAGPEYKFRVDDTGVYVGLKLQLPDTNATGTAGVLEMGGSTFLHNAGSGNTFLGEDAGRISGGGAFNAAIGYEAGGGSGSSNVSIGYQASSYIFSGDNNAATGMWALRNNGGDDNTANGFRALEENRNGANNVALGSGALIANVDGSNNTALGTGALAASTGSFNIAVGNGSGAQLTTGSFNVNISNGGVAGESNTLRIGNANQTRAFIAGIRGVTTGAANAVSVMVDSNGQLGTASSSRRFKYDIADAGEATSGLMRLRPVTFRYRSHGPRAPLQYGLIAEEVARVYPELIARDQTGQIETVMYQFLAPMLLSEVQKHQRTIVEQQKTIDELQAALAAFGARLEALEARQDR